MTRLAFILAAAGLLIAVASSTKAQGQCAPREAIVGALMSRWGETPQTVALAPDGSLVETFASLDTGTWTLLVTRPDGVSCLVASGEAFALVAPSNTDPGA